MHTGELWRTFGGLLQIKSSQLNLLQFQIIGYFTISTNVELQQRSVEYRTIFKQYDGMRTALLERMPVTVAPEKQQPDKIEALLDVSLLANKILVLFIQSYNEFFMLCILGLDRI